MIDAKAITQRIRLVLQRAGGAMQRKSDGDTASGRIADSESASDGRSQPLFRPRHVRTPSGKDWS